MKRRPLRPRRFPDRGRRPPFPPSQQHFRQGRQPVHPLLEKAHHLMANREYLRAAVLFEKLADEAAKRNFPRAPHLYLQAGRANILADQVDDGMSFLYKGLQLLVEQNRSLDLQRVGNRVIQELQEIELTDQAVQIEEWLNEVNPEGEIVHGTPFSIAGDKNYRLPVNCSSCGGALHPEQVDWIDEMIAECSYCGNMVRAEEA